jgi:hypothetical protein
VIAAAEPPLRTLSPDQRRAHHSRRGRAWLLLVLALLGGGCGGAPVEPGGRRSGRPVHFERVESGVTADLLAVHVEADGAIWIAGPGPTLRRLAGGRAEDATEGLPAGARVTALLGGAGPPGVAAVQWEGHAGVFTRSGTRWTRQGTVLAGCLSPAALAGLPGGRLVATCAYYPVLSRVSLAPVHSEEHALPLGFDRVLVRGEDDVVGLNVTFRALWTYRGGPWAEVSWQERAVPDATRALAAHGRDLVVVGAGGFAARSAGGDADFTPEATGTTAQLAAAWATAAGVVAVGERGTALVREPAGWRALPTPTTAWLRAVRSAGPHVAVVGAGGVVLRLVRE